MSTGSYSEDDGQFNLFSWQPGEPRASTPVATARRDDVAAMSRDELLTALETAVENACPEGPLLIVLLREAARRHEPEAVPHLVTTCRRFAGFDRERAVPEVAVALRTLVALRARAAAPEVLRLVQANALGLASVAEALDLFTAVRFHRAVVGLAGWLADGDGAVRAAACRLAAVIGGGEHVALLVRCSTDIRSDVAEAALLALGRLGYRPVKRDLEERLRRAVPEEALPALLAAIAPVADDDSAIVVGRRTERTRNPDVRYRLAEALADMEGSVATTWLLRLVGDPHPAIRRVVAEALGERDDVRGRAALAILQQDSEPCVAQAARAALGVRRD